LVTTSQLITHLNGFIKGQEVQGFMHPCGSFSKSEYCEPKKFHINTEFYQMSIPHTSYSQPQRSQIDALYSAGQIFDMTFDKNDEDQVSVAVEMATHGLYVEAWEWLDSHWSVQWKAIQDNLCRVLYQCVEHKSANKCIINENPLE
jgi:hypothetical protein